jgi:tRNA (guanine-N(7)-)-methyltransferase subunit TRM82
MPYQCLARCGSVLVAARESSIDSFSIEDGSLLSTWKVPPNGKAKISTLPLEEVATKLGFGDIAINSSNPPAKRRKLSEAAENPPVLNGGEGEEKKKKAKSRPDTFVDGLEGVIALTATGNGHHVIAVTEDKAIRVLEIVTEENGKPFLNQISERYDVSRNSY